MYVMKEGKETREELQKRQSFSERERERDGVCIYCGVFIVLTYLQVDHSLVRVYESAIVCPLIVSPFPVVALEPHTGQLLWQCQAPSGQKPVTAMCVTGDGYLCVAAGGLLYGCLVRNSSSVERQSHTHTNTLTLFSLLHPFICSLNILISRQART